MADRSQYPSEQADKFLLRLPDGMRDVIRERAKVNRRSMTNEIVVLLERALPAGNEKAEAVATLRPE